MRYLNTRDALMIILVIPLILPTSLNSFLGISHFIAYTKIVCLLFLMAMLLIDRVRFDGYLAFVFLFCFILFFSTAIHNGSFPRCFNTILDIVNPVLWCRISMSKERFYPILHGFTFILCLIALIDIICYLLFPDGIIHVQTGELSVRAGIISNDNSIAPYLIPACILSIFYLTIIKASLLKKVAIYVLFVFAVFFVNTGVGMFISILCALLIIIYTRYEKISKILNLNIIGLVLIGVFFLVCVFQMTDWLSSILQVFNSNNSFSGRTTLWTYVVSKIIQSPVLGYGIQDNIYLIGYAYRTTAHNMFFQIVLWTGFLGLVPIILIILKTIKKGRHYWDDSKEIRLLFTGIIGMMIYFMVEVHVFVPIFWILLTVINYYDIVKSLVDSYNRHSGNIRII